MPRSARTPLTPRDRSRLTERASLGLEPAGFRFSEARHGLTPAQVRQANQRLRHLEQTRPIREQAKMALRIAGIVSAVKRGAVGNSRFGRRLHGKRGGRVMQRHGMHILQAIYPVGLLAIKVAREKRAAQAYYETHGEVLPLGTQPPATMEQQRIQEMTALWEEQQWQTQQAEHLKW